MDAKKSEKYDVIQEMFVGWTWERRVRVSIEIL